jgi:hypothetical protein
MPDLPPTSRPAAPWQAGYDAAIDDVMALLDEFDIRRSSLTGPLMYGLRENVDELRSDRRTNAA